MELVHPFHEHPLKTGEQKHDDKQLVCSGCAAPILPGLIFICSKQRCKFVLHKSCAELPKEIIHFSHTKHPLKLLEKPPYNENIWCDHCKDTIEGFVYHCSICKYDLDITCASVSVEVVEMELMHPFHKYPLKPGEQKHDDKQLVCSGCSAPILPGPIFICSKQRCKFVLHKSCAELPKEITHFSHTEHPLKLLEEPPYNAISRCDHCKDTIEGFVYRCFVCDFDLDITCASMSVEEVEMELVHPFHEHPLKPGEQKHEDKQLVCSGCSAPILPGPIFICSKQRCKFVLHKSCAELPKEITHFFHTRHPLKLLEKPPYIENIWCDHCKDTIEGFVYHCSICKYDLDITCASMSLEVVEMELMHPFHKHPLKPGEQKHDDKQLVCSGCSAPILPGPIFICSKHQGCKFVLHKSCAELPMEILHFSHTQHPLILQCESPYKDGNSWCDNCGNSTKAFVYHCDTCSYDLDVMCASLRSSYIVYEEDHEHKFVMIKPIPFTCDICGKETKGEQSYLCITCQAHVHPTCSSLPRVAKLFTHSCPLNLTFGHQLEKPIDTINQFCRTCWKTVDTRYAFYYCVDCEYIGDIGCARNKYYRDYQFDLETNTSSSLRYKDIGKIDLQTWHGHGLVLCKDEITTDDQEVVCRGCVSIISKSAPFYECKEKCGYTLHESCVNLYEKIRHPFHYPHDLVLSDESTFICSLCLLQCNGFRYSCKHEGCESIAEYDLKCALRPVVIHIEMAHQHPLRIISEGEHYDKKCRGCSSGCASVRYSCPDFDYNLCDRCVGLPTSAKHSWDEHPLVLTYESVPHEYGEYYCDQCEEPRDPNHWFYYCEICDRCVHTKCMGLHNLNLQKRTYGLKCHPGHTLILKANPQFYPTCSDCGFACTYLYLQCLNCKYWIHPNCALSRE